MNGDDQPALDDFLGGVPDDKLVQAAPIAAEGMADPIIGIGLIAQDGGVDLVMTGSPKHCVAVVALHGVAHFDLGIPIQVFGATRSEDGASLYRVDVCGEAPRVRGMSFDIYAPFAMDHVATADTVIVPGIEDLHREIPMVVIRALQDAAARGARIASICTGAFVLAAAGLLSGKRATTHWSGTEELARLYPDVTVDPEVLFVDEGAIVTSAGASAGLDMCLQLVRRDWGQAVAAGAARTSVAPLDRDGGQSQFIRREPPTSRASLAPLLEWMSTQCSEPLDLAKLAERARLSPRTLARRFREQTGTSPIQWLLAARIRLAQEILETTSQSIDEIATACGFETINAFREQFQRRVGVGPSAHRRRFNARGAPAVARRPRAPNGEIVA